MLRMRRVGDRSLGDIMELGSGYLGTWDVEQHVGNRSNDRDLGDGLR